MIHKLYKLSKYIPENTLEDNPLDLNLNYKDGNIYFFDIITINANDGTKDFKFNKIIPEEYDTYKNKNLYLLKNAKANSVSKFPTLSVYSKDDLLGVEGEFYFESDCKITKKMMRILNENSKINKELVPLVSLFEKLIEENKLNDIQELPLSYPFILSLKIDNKYLGESPYYKQILTEALSSNLSEYFNKHETTSLAKSKVCNLCNKNSSEVWGFTSTFNFYSCNEYASIAGGFKQEESWKNYPVCPECAIALKQGKVFLENFFRYNFYGYDYFVIPEIIFDSNENNEVIEIFLSSASEKTKQSIISNRQRITNDEHEVFDRLAEQNNQASYNLFFYKVNKAEFKILLSIDYVFPSRFKQIFDAKTKVEDKTINNFFEKIKNKDGYYNLEFNFGILKNFLIYEKKFDKGGLDKKNFEKDFLEITRDIFTNKKIKYDFIIERIMMKLRPIFSHNDYMELDVLKAIMLIKFLHTLELLDERKKHSEKEIKLESIYEDFFKKHPEFFETNTKKGIFLLGVLCQKLLNIQYQERKVTPFRERLNGLKINKKIITRLLPEIINKLEEYRKNYYKLLETEISRYLLDSQYELSDDELSFIFVMGMTLYKEFNNENEEALSIEGADNE